MLRPVINSTQRLGQREISNGRGDMYKLQDKMMVGSMFPLIFHSTLCTSTVCSLHHDTESGVGWDAHVEESFERWGQCCAEDHNS